MIHAAEDIETLRLAVARHLAGAYGEAFAALRGLSRRHPGDPTVCLAMGNAALECGAFGEAARAFELAMRAGPEDDRLQALRANALSAMGRHGEAEPLYRAVLERTPESVGARRGLARLLAATARPAAAAEAYERLLQQVPEEAGSWWEYGKALLAAGRSREADAALARVLAMDPADSRGATLLRRQLAEDGAPATLPQDFVARQFDGFAESFERQLVDKLKYDVPGRLRSLVDEVLGAGAAPQPTLDLGCGTGLCAAAFAGLADPIDGVDLSAGMLARARAGGRYRALCQGEIAAVLPALPGRYSLALAADVLIYVGDPLPWFVALADRLEPGGLFALSYELGEGDGFALPDTLRYRHAPDYIAGRLAEAGFRELMRKPARIRLENGRPVTGMLAAARREAA